MIFHVVNSGGLRAVSTFFKVNGMTLLEDTSIHKEFRLTDLEVDCCDTAYLYRNQFARNIHVDIDGTMNFQSGAYAETISADPGAYIQFAIDATVKDVS